MSIMLHFLQRRLETSSDLMGFPLNIFLSVLRSVLTFDVGFEEVSTVSCAIKSQGQTAFKPLALSWHKQRMAEEFPSKPRGSGRHTIALF